MRHLIDHIDQRGGTEATTRVLRSRSGRPMGRRRYDTLSLRIRTHPSWAAALQFSVQRLRHTTLTWIEREFGVAIAHAYAGHTTRSTARAGTTFTYITPSIVEIAEALSDSPENHTHSLGAIGIHGPRDSGH